MVYHIYALLLSTTFVTTQICHEQFVALHSEPILSDLAMLWEKKFGGLK